MHGLGIQNNNGMRLMNFCDEAGLVVGGTMFPHRDIHKGTWRSPNLMYVNQIDHIIISRRHKSFLQDVRAYRGADIGQTDHYLLIGKIKLKLKKIQRNGRKPVFDSGRLRNENVREEFRQKLEDGFQAARQTDTDSMNVEESWSNIKRVYNETAEVVLGRRRKRTEEWISEEAWQLIKEKKELKVKIESSSDISVKQRFKVLHKQKAISVKSLTRRDKRRFRESKAEEAEEAARRGDQRTLYRIAGDLGGGYSGGNDGILKDRNGNKIVKEEDKIKRWQEHFQSVLNGNPPEEMHEFEDYTGEDLPVDVGTIRHDEICRAIRKMKNNKAPGEDYITGEMLKVTVEDTAVRKLHDLFHLVWSSETCPEDWKCGTIIKLPKKGNLADCNNWRGITLLSVPCKVLAEIVLERIYESLEQRMREGQAGFRKGRSCADQIFVLRNIIEQSVEWRRGVVINFIDFKKAFDSLHRPTMWNIIRSYGLPQKIINIIRMMYEGTTSCVRVGGTNTERFEITSGVRQGDVLSPVLFIIVLDWVMRRTFDISDGIPWVDGSRLTELAYADDIGLLAENIQSMNRVTEKLESEAAKVGLEINTRKTKIMKIQCNEDATVVLGGNDIEEVSSFEYLGSYVCNDGDVRKEVGVRIAKAGAMFSKMKKVWNDCKLSLKTKLKLFNSIIISVLIYGCETWKGLKEVENRLRVFESNCLRKILKIQWYEHISEEEVRRRSGQKSVILEMGLRRWRYYGHALRMESGRLPKQVMSWTPDGSRRPGRPKDTWRRTIQREKRNGGFEAEDVENIAERRDDWRRFIADLWATRPEQD